VQVILLRDLPIQCLALAGVEVLTLTEVCILKQDTMGPPHIRLLCHICPGLEEDLDLDVDGGVVEADGFGVGSSEVDGDYSGRHSLKRR